MRDLVFSVECLFKQALTNNEQLITHSKNGGLAQLARAPALHAGGHRFDSDILHKAMLRDINLKVL